jgi:hypothetical protein
MKGKARKFHLTQAPPKRVRMSPCHLVTSKNRKKVLIKENPCSSATWILMVVWNCSDDESILLPSGFFSFMGNGKECIFYDFIVQKFDVKQYLGFESETLF